MGRGTYRPHNTCKGCGYTWYPRGKDISQACPRCKGSNTDITLFEKIKVIAGITFVIYIIGYMIFKN